MPDADAPKTTSTGVHLDDALWETIQRSVPIVCTDVVPVRRVDGTLQVGLILRRFPGSSVDVWCHLGGRVRYGETTGEAVRRHLASTLEHAQPTELGDDPQPHTVVQWFPADVRSDPRFGDDPRKHAVSLCWALDLGPDLIARDGGEGTELRWFDVPFDPAALEATGAGLWPGTSHLVSTTLAGADLI